jgi:hypothetical protein
MHGNAALALQPQTRRFQLVENMVVDGEILHREGEFVTLAVNPADVTNQTEVLDSYLGGYVPFGFAADMFSKVVIVGKEAGQRRDFSKENAFQRVDTKSGRDGKIREVDHKSELGSYRVQEYALATWIPWATENDAESLYNIRSAAGEMIMWKLALDREVRIFTSLTTVGNWGANNRTTLTTNFKWDNGSTKNPRLDLHNRLKASAQPVTDIGMNPDVAYYYLSDNEVRANMKQMLGDQAVDDMIARAAQAGETGVETFKVPGLPPIHVLPAKVLNESTGNLDYIMPNDVLLVTNQPGVPRDGQRVATHWTFRHRGRSGTGVVTNEYIPQGRGLNSGTMFEAGFSDDSFFGSLIAGGLIKGALSF